MVSHRKDTTSMFLLDWCLGGVDGLADAAELENSGHRKETGSLNNLGRRNPSPNSPCGIPQPLSVNSAYCEPFSWEPSVCAGRVRDVNADLPLFSASVCGRLVYFGACGSVLSASANRTTTCPRAWC